MKRRKERELRIDMTATDLHNYSNGSSRSHQNQRHEKTTKLIKQNGYVKILNIRIEPTLSAAPTYGYICGVSYITSAEKDTTLTHRVR